MNPLLVPSPAQTLVLKSNEQQKKNSVMELQLIQNKIYEIRGRRVMLDFDLAEMYGIETAQL